MSLQRGINLRALAEKMGHCSGAEVRGICTEAGVSFPKGLFSFIEKTNYIWSGMYALRERRQHVTQEDFEFAVAKVLSHPPVIFGNSFSMTLFPPFRYSRRTKRGTLQSTNCSRRCFYSFSISMTIFPLRPCVNVYRVTDYPAV